MGKEHLIVQPRSLMHMNRLLVCNLGHVHASAVVTRGQHVAASSFSYAFQPAVHPCTASWLMNHLN